MSISKGGYVAKFCRPNESYRGKIVPKSNRGPNSGLWLVAITQRRGMDLNQVSWPGFKSFETFEKAKAWAVDRLNELVAQEQAT